MDRDTNTDTQGCWQSQQSISIQLSLVDLASGATKPSSHGQYKESISSKEHQDTLWENANAATSYYLCICPWLIKLRKFPFVWHSLRPTWVAAGQSSGCLVFQVSHPRSSVEDVHLFMLSFSLRFSHISPSLSPFLICCSHSPLPYTTWCRPQFIMCLLLRSLWIAHQRGADMFLCVFDCYSWITIVLVWKKTKNSP